MHKFTRIFENLCKFAVKEANNPAKKPTKDYKLKTE